ncbi:hypothetical protein Q8A73_014437 [Channa argus]|nr:hypothetical protein Q8A73_014437 [Channa argus]
MNRRPGGQVPGSGSRCWAVRWIAYKRGENGLRMKAQGHSVRLRPCQPLSRLPFVRPKGITRYSNWPRGVVEGGLPLISFLDPNQVTLILFLSLGRPTPVLVLTVLRHLPLGWSTPRLSPTLILLRFLLPKASTPPLVLTDPFSGPADASPGPVPAPAFGSATIYSALMYHDYVIHL